MAQPGVILIHYLYLAKLNLVLSIGCLAQFVEHWTDDVEIAGSNPLYATIFLTTMFTCLHKPLQVDTHNKND